MLIFRKSTGIKSAVSLFKKGKFEESEEHFKKSLSEKPKNFEATVYLGYIYLLSNKIEQAEEFLLKALKKKPGNKYVNWMLSELYYRKNDYIKAAEYFKVTKRKSMVRKLMSFKDCSPYTITSKVDCTTIKFIKTNPLPVVQVQLMNQETANLFIDTGGGEIILDKKIASKLNLPDFGFEKGPFAGGKTGKFSHSKLDLLAIGDFTVKNLPVLVMDFFGSVEQYFDGIPIHGVLGTNILFQFLSTIDYLNGELVLNNKDDCNLNEWCPKISFEIPFWLAPDHFIIANGSINNSSSMLFFIDTGLIGGSFIAPKSTLKELNIRLDKSNRVTGEGGGGNVKSTIFTIDKLSLGSTCVENTIGVYQKFPWENMFGFRLGGLISHDFFKNYSVTFDFKNMKLYLNKYMY